jgi:hypothetical protein
LRLRKAYDMRVIVGELEAWFEETKLPQLGPNLESRDADLLSEIEEEVLAKLKGLYDVTTWVSAETTPKIVRVAIAKMFASWYYNRQYSEDQEDTNPYADKLQLNADSIIAGLIDGTIPVDPSLPVGQPIFYPTDESSASEPTPEDPSLGPARFSMGTVF